MMRRDINRMAYYNTAPNGPVLTDQAIAEMPASKRAVLFELFSIMADEDVFQPDKVSRS